MTEQTEVLRYIVGPVCTNCYLLVNHKTGELLVVDPGDQAQLIEKQIEKTGAKPVAILLTHGHFDHAGAAEALADKYQISFVNIMCVLAVIKMHSCIFNFIFITSGNSSKIF